MDSRPPGGPPVAWGEQRPCVRAPSGVRWSAGDGPLRGPRPSRMEPVARGAIAQWLEQRTHNAAKRKMQRSASPRIIAQFASVYKRFVR